MPYEKIPAFVRTLPEIELPVPGARGWLIQGAGQQAMVVFNAPDRYLPRI